MRKNEAKPFEKSSDLLKIYREAYEKTKYMQDIDDKLLAYNEVISYCADSKRCRVDDSIKRNQILFWTYNNIGDMFLARNHDEPAANNYIYAVQYYRNALEFTDNAREKHATMEKMLHVYTELQDENGWRNVQEMIAMEEDDSLKRQAFVELAKSTDDPKLQAKYLEQALGFVMEENVSVLNKCQNTLEICRHLADIYQTVNDKAGYERIRRLQKSTLELLN